MGLRWPGKTPVALIATGAAAVLVAALLAGLTLHRSPSDPSAADQSPTAGASTSTDPVRAFLTNYVDPDGRVVRRDQGGDTVSEGQAYAMLLAAAIADEPTFDKVWTWTKANLGRDDGLLSWKYDGQIVDANSAADADLDAAHALVVAASVFDRPGLRTDGIKLGTAILDHETRMTPLGRLLVGGSWATATPYAVNPSYLSPVALTSLSAASGDPRWNELAEGYGRLLSRATAGAALPPDWVQVTADGKVNPMRPPDNTSVAFGLDAARIPVRAAISCRDTDRAEAARLARTLVRSEDDVRGSYDLGGGNTVDWQHPLAFVAAAAAAGAAGDSDAETRLLAAAVTLNRRTPTYYGAAWTALGSIWLDDRSGPISPCPKGATQ